MTKTRKREAAPPAPAKGVPTEPPAKTVPTVVDRPLPFVTSVDYASVEFYNAKAPRVINLNLCAKYGIPVNELLEACKDNSREWVSAMKPYAFAMFMDRLPVSHIDKALALGTDCCKDWAKKGKWHATREEAEKQYHIELVQQKANQMSQMAAVAMEGVSKAIAKYARGTRTMTLMEAEKISKILVNMDKLTRLASGQPTEIVEQRGGLLEGAASMTIKDIIRTLTEDPMTIDVTPTKGEE